MIPCLAATLLLGSMAVADVAGAESTEKVDSSAIKVAHKMEGKKRGLENALENVKNPIAREAIKRNLERQEARKKDKEDKKDKKHKKDAKCDKENVTLGTFTIGGVDVSDLAGLTTETGAVLKVDDFNDFKGIKVEAENDDTDVTISLNASKVHEDYWNSILLRANDVIVIKVTNGETTQDYKVTLVEKVDISLNTFTIGGIDVRKLEGINTEEGSTLKVDDFTNFKGIVVEAEDEDAEVTVSLNGSTVNKDYLASLLLRAKDVIVVTVENGETEEDYKVTIVESEDISLSKFTIGGVDVMSLQGITNTSGAVLEVDNFTNFKGIIVEAKNDAEVTVTLNGSSVHKDYLTHIPLRLDDVIVTQVKEGSTTQTYKVTLQQK